MDITTRRRAPDDTRAEIIEKALEVAAELGASGFTLDAVAARTTVSKGALLHHFPSKIACWRG
jgi:AcrR family transcriptional regulator